jgi:hypothetical protein
LGHSAWLKGAKLLAVKIIALWVLLSLLGPWLHTTPRLRLASRSLGSSNKVRANHVVPQIDSTRAIANAIAIRMMARRSMALSI